MSWTLAELADFCGGRVKGDPGYKIEGFAAADESRPGKLSFVTSVGWLDKLSPGTAVVLPPSLEDRAEGFQAIVAEDPRLAFALILNKVTAPGPPEPGLHPSAVVAADAQIDPTARVGALAFIGDRSAVGARTSILPRVYVGEDVKIGADCVLYPHCYIGNGSVIGDRVVLGPGVSIGYDGFGYQWDGTRHVKIPQVGIAVIEDGVQIGALSAVDRAALGETRIGEGTIIDNLVMVGHNCRIGRNVILISQVGLAGGARIDDGAVVAGQVGVGPGVKIGAGAMVAGQSGVAKDVPPGAKVGGTPARTGTAWLRSQLMADKVPEIRKELQKIQKRLDALEKITQNSNPDDTGERDK